MIGTWNIPEVEDRNTFDMILENLRESGHESAVLFITHMPFDPDAGIIPDEVREPPTPSHMMYFLVCTDPDGKWFWLSDRDDTGWTEVQLNSTDTLHYVGKPITLIVAH